MFGWTKIAPDNERAPHNMPRHIPRSRSAEVLVACGNKLPLKRIRPKQNKPFPSRPPCMGIVRTFTKMQSVDRHNTAEM